MRLRSSAGACCARIADRRQAGAIARRLRLRDGSCDGPHDPTGRFTSVASSRSPAAVA
ncbi:hypothetical protein [Lysobacter gummosus]|uniref:hypothetical protein n=1 Tax=Lysobacter gummosus TaxID=262324 RepID=UPI0036444071